MEERAISLRRDCNDGLFTAYWARPEVHLEAHVRSNMSNFALTAEQDVAPSLAALQADRWRSHHAAETWYGRPIDGQ